jgi:MFS family permease
MPLGFYIILAAQFFSALADNALLFAALALLKDLSAPEWYTPVLQQGFIVSFIILAHFVGSFADSIPKGRVMFISNSIKLVGCFAMLFGVHPLLAYGMVGLGAAIYSPAKYGILTEYLPHSKLVLANSWMEGLTIAAIILGALTGKFSAFLLGYLSLQDIPFIHSQAEFSIIIIVGLYIIAALFNLGIPRLMIEHTPMSRNPILLVKQFTRCFWLLWRVPLRQVSLAVTTLFWGAGATLRLLVLAWAAVALSYNAEQAQTITAWVGVGIAIGATLAARFVQLEHSVKVLPIGIAMGIAVFLMIPTSNDVFAAVLLLSIGAMAGYFVVPMNALLQHRGHQLMGAGSSIAVQNFNENIGIFAMLALYALMAKLEIGINFILLVFGLVVSGSMTVLYKRHRHDQDDGQV